jgi:hypothetical protein
MWKMKRHPVVLSKGMDSTGHILKIVTSSKSNRFVSG